MPKRAVRTFSWCQFLDRERVCVDSRGVNIRRDLCIETTNRARRRVAVALSAAAAAVTLGLGSNGPVGAALRQQAATTTTTTLVCTPVGHDSRGYPINNNCPPGQNGNGNGQGNNGNGTGTNGNGGGNGNGNQGNGNGNGGSVTSKPPVAPTAKAAVAAAGADPQKLAPLYTG
jgi:hypothetical protein